MREINFTFALPKLKKTKRLGKMTQAKILAAHKAKFSQRIAENFGIPMGNVSFSRYSDGEFQPSFEESVRGSKVFIIGSTHPSSDNLMKVSCSMRQNVRPHDILPQ